MSGLSTLEIELLRELVEEGRPEYDTANGKGLGDNGICSYCHEIECDHDCLFERAKKLVAASSLSTLR